MTIRSRPRPLASTTSSSSDLSSAKRSCWYSYIAHKRLGLNYREKILTSGKESFTGAFSFSGGIW